MGNSIKLPRAKVPTLSQQLSKLKTAQPESIFKFSEGGNRLVWIGYLQPTSISAVYRIRIELKRSNSLVPDVYVEAPKLVDRDDESVPHLYDRDKAKLCLWLPGSGEWTARLWISESVLLWASEWLFFYEVWLATGEWLGGGEHPPNQV